MKVIEGISDRSTSVMFSRTSVAHLINPIMIIMLTIMSIACMNMMKLRQCAEYQCRECTMPKYSDIHRIAMQSYKGDNIQNMCNKPHYNHNVHQYDHRMHGAKTILRILMYDAKIF